MAVASDATEEEPDADGGRPSPDDTNEVPAKSAARTVDSQNLFFMVSDDLNSSLTIWPDEKL
jgi:hypothetical protein